MQICQNHLLLISFSTSTCFLSNRRRSSSSSCWRWRRWTGMWSRWPCWWHWQWWQWWFWWLDGHHSLHYHNHRYLIIMIIIIRWLTFWLSPSSPSSLSAWSPSCSSWSRSPPEQLWDGWQSCCRARCSSQPPLHALLAPCTIIIISCSSINSIIAGGQDPGQVVSAVRRLLASIPRAGPLGLSYHSSVITE